VKSGVFQAKEELKDSVEEEKEHEEELVRAKMHEGGGGRRWKPYEIGQKNRERKWGKEKWRALVSQREAFIESGKKQIRVQWMQSS